MRIPNFRTRTVPLALLVVCLLSFGLLAPWLGFYWDDWPTIWYYHILGPAGMKEVFAIDRPLLGWLFMLTTSLVGQSTLGWQLFGIFTRWLSCLALWWALRSLWPKHTLQVTTVAFLYAVYPGFKQQYIAVTYSSDWIALTLFFLSFGLMIWAIRKPSWFWPLMVASWLLSAFVMFADEYYFGLEFLRPVFLWIVLSQKTTELLRRIREVAIRWLPYVAIMAVFLVWRLILHESPRAHVQIFKQLEQGPVGALLQLGQTIIKDMLQSSLIAWSQIGSVSSLAGESSMIIVLYAGLVLFTAAISIFYLARLRERDNPEEGTIAPKGWAIWATGLGVFALFLGGWPFWVTGLPIGLNFPWDRFNLAMMLGASLLLAGLLELLARTRLQKALILGVVIGLATGMHFQQANLFRREWNTQKDFFWQLTWRAPEIEPGTAVLTADAPFTFYSDNSLTAPLNWVYAPGNKSREMSYVLYAIESRLGVQITDFQKGQTINQLYRVTSFKGSTSQALVVYYTPPGCVKVVDPSVDRRLPQKPDYFSEILPLSDIRTIETQANPPARPPAEFFDPEPTHGWCYDFEKADLARQMGDWQKVVELGNQAFKRNERLYPVNAPELLPYIEGYARLGKWDRAQALTLEAYHLTFRMNRMLCSNWNRIQASTPDSPQRQAAIADIQSKLKCSSLQIAAPESGQP